MLIKLLGCRRSLRSASTLAGLICALLVLLYTLDKATSGRYIRIAFGGVKETGFSRPVEEYVSHLLKTDPRTAEFVDTSEADALFDKVRILCLILTTEANLHTRARAVNATWARRCNSHYFVLQTRYEKDDVIMTPYNDTRNNLIYKVRHAMIHAYTNLMGTFDWVLKADDDTYVILENLRFLLSNYDKDKPGYLGYHFNMYVENHGYMSGGAGYVMSVAALRQMVDSGLNNDACALTKTYLIAEVSEDFEIGKCLKIAGVPILSSMDVLGRETFHPYPFEQYLLDFLPEYLYDWSNTRPQRGYNCCSPFSISFHYMKPETMLMMDHLLYRIHIHGRNTAGNQAGKSIFRLERVENMRKPKVVIDKIA